ncbi:hypothetical protein ACP4OV_023498 [Aristida adscensionis]
MEKKHRPGRSRSFAAAGGGLAAFLRSTVASFSSASAAAFQSHGGKASFNHRNAFSGPIVSIVPPEARGGGGGGSRRKRSGYRTPEPSSPKVSCIGQIKRSKSKKKVNPCGKSGGSCPLPPRRPAAAAPAPAEGSCRPRGSSFVKRMFSRRSMSRSRSRNGRPGHGKGAHAAAAAVAAPAAAGIGQMKRFTSGRAAFQDFDWREAETTDHDDYDDEGFVAHSAPLVLGGGVVAMEPRKEVNLWRRRPMAPPTPLQLP